MFYSLISSVLCLYGMLQVRKKKNEMVFSIAKEKRWICA